MNPTELATIIVDTLIIRTATEMDRDAAIIEVARVIRAVETHP